MIETILNYSFNAATGSITLGDQLAVDLPRLKEIYNQTAKAWIYRVHDADLGESFIPPQVTGNVLNFGVNFTSQGMANTDLLLINYDNAKEEVLGNLAALNQSVWDNQNGKNAAVVIITGTFNLSISIEQSNDGFVSDIRQPLCKSLTSNANFAAVNGLAITTVQKFLVPCYGENKIRVRCSAYTSGNASVRIVPIDADLSALDLLSITGTVTANEGGFAAPSASNINSAASTNISVVKATPGNVYGISMSNNNAAARFVKLYNKATAPVLGTDVPVMVIPVPPNSFISYEFGKTGHRFPLGIGIAITGLIGDADATAIGAGEVKVALTFI